LEMESCKLFAQAGFKLWSSQYHHPPPQVPGIIGVSHQCPTVSCFLVSCLFMFFPHFCFGILDIWLSIFMSSLHIKNIKLL
jgi:hypothetical protein